MQTLTDRVPKSLIIAGLTAWVVMQSAPAACQVLHDNFDDNVMSAAAWSPWVTTNGPSIAATNQRVEITMPADSTTNERGAYVSLKCKLNGDFDFQVDYILLTFPSAAGVAVHLQAVTSPDGGPDGPNVNIARQSTNSGEVYFAHRAPTGPLTVVSTSDRSGTLRITRSGSLGTAYYMSSTGWIALHSEQLLTSPALVGFGPNANFMPNPVVKVAYDNFIVNQGELVGCNVCPDATEAGLMTRPKLTISKLNTPVGDDKLSFTGQLSLSWPFSPALDPLANGVRLLLKGTAGSLLDAIIPDGAFDGSTGKGWKVNGSGTKWTYQDKTVTPSDGIAKVVIQDRSTASPGLVKFRVKGKAGSYAVVSADLPVTARLILAPPVGKCGDTSFSRCAFNSSGSTLRCK